MYIWTNDAGVKFQEVLNSPTMQDKIKMFLENSKSYTANDILKAVSDVENIILSAANMSLSKPKQKKKKKNYKKWFYNDLDKLREKVLASSSRENLQQVSKRSCN